MSEKPDQEVALEAGAQWMCKCGKSADSLSAMANTRDRELGPEKLVLEEAAVVLVK